MQTGDSYWFRWPYDLDIPNTIPGTSTPGHDIYWSAGLDETAALGYDYFLQDNTERDASWFQVDCYAPDLTSQGSVNNSTHVGVHHEGNLGPEITIFKADPYLMVFRAVDSHGSDGPAWCHREHENKRMLARNGREPGSIEAVTWETLPGTDNLPLDENPGNGMGGSHIGLRIFPGKKTANDSPDLAQTRATVLVRVKTDIRYGNVVIKAFDVDDPSIHADPIDQEQSWPAQANDDNRDGSSPAFGFDGSDGIQVKTDANGEATADFVVGQCPGDNYRVVACLQHDAGVTVLRAKPEDAEARVFDLGPGGTGPGDEVPSAGAPSKYRASGVLTVWQRVFYEYDRMTLPGTYLAQDAHTGDQHLITDGPIAFPQMVAIFDRLGHILTDIYVANCQVDGAVYRLTLSSALQNEFLKADGSYVVPHSPFYFEDTLMRADVGLLDSAFEIAYVLFEPAGTGEGVVPLLTQITKDYGMESAYREMWFGGVGNPGNVIWLIGASYSVEPTYTAFGLSSPAENWSAVFTSTILQGYGGLFGNNALKEFTVHEVGRQFGLLDWDDRPDLDEDCIGGLDGDVMIHARHEGPPPPYHPNIRDNGIARFGTTNIGGEPPSIRGAQFPL